LRKIPEVEINANYFFNDSVNDSRYSTSYLLIKTEEFVQLGFLLQLTLTYIPWAFLFYLTK
jgi:hypothetical protein